MVLIPGFFDGFTEFFTSAAPLITLAGVVFGLVLGAIPGLGPLTGMALGIPLTFVMEPVNGMILLLSIYAGSVSGGAVSSILLNVPGTPGSIATCFDGFPLSQQGRGREAISIGMTASAIGALGGAAIFVVVGPLLGRISRLLGPAEFAALILLAFVMIAWASREDGVKGLLTACFGLLMSFVGRDVTTATPRFSEGVIFLEEGVPFVAAALGLYCMSQVIKFAAHQGTIAQVSEMAGSLLRGVRLTFSSPGVVIRSWLLGGIIGLLPGIGIVLSGLMNWAVQRRFDRDPQSYGRGNPRGIIASEVGNNATATGSLATTFALGIPGGATDAILLGGLLLYGLRPGPTFFAPSGNELFFPVLAWALILGPIFIAASVFVIRYLALLTEVPFHTLIPIIGVLTIVGAFATRGQFFDVWVMLVFGVIGYFMEKGGYPIQNVVIGMVLGALFEQNLNRALILSDGSLDIFWDRPVARTAVMIGVALLVLTFVNVRDLSSRLKRRFGNERGVGVR